MVPGRTATKEKTMLVPTIIVVSVLLYSFPAY